jgi:hypothetical protein
MFFFLFRRECFRESPDLYWTDGSMLSPVKLTDEKQIPIFFPWEKRKAMNLAIRPSRPRKFRKK